jgi:Asp-tRNA(Asn)/Glu-tRNA(Gln) amidotransferase C subunit
MQESKPIDHIDEMLSKPTWSVRSLLPFSSLETPPEDEITPAKLHHLLRLSALPLPTSPEEEASMLKTLHSQLHFVRDIQKVDTEGVEPLVAIRDETEEGIREITIGVEQVKDALEMEEVVGRNRRPRRRTEGVGDLQGVEDWDVLRTAGEKVEGPTGKFFVVRSGKGKTGEKPGV